MSNLNLNLGYTFYRNNRTSVEVDFGREIVERAKQVRVKSQDYFEVKNTHKVTFKTIYPGMVIGLGYTHEKELENDFQLGFLFDYTTGLPYIPGSSVKGAIRSMFPANKEDKQHIDFINSLLTKEYTYDEIYELEKSIFGKSTEDSNTIDDVNSKDIFYDAYFATGVGGFLSTDYITPHKGDELKSPDPLKFLKITPDTKVTLQFELKENTFLSKEERLKIFVEILEWTGLGAKTNLGYGVVENAKYSYGEIEDKGTIKELFYALKERQKEEKNDEMILGLSEHEQIAEKSKGSTKEMIKILQDNTCSKEARKPLAKLIKSKLISHASTWKNAKKGALANKEFIEEILR